jgi:hypothetical protein
MRHAIVASLVSLAACAFEPSGPGDLGPGPDPDPPLADVDGGAATPTPPAPVDCRVQGPDLGVVGLTVAGPQGVWRFDGWQVTPGGDLVGFVISGPPDPRYEVRADDDRFWGRDMFWVHPELSRGDAEPIERIDFCATPGGGDD